MYDDVTKFFPNSDILCWVGGGGGCQSASLCHGAILCVIGAGE